MPDQILCRLLVVGTMHTLKKQLNILKIKHIFSILVFCGVFSFPPRRKEPKLNLKSSMFYDTSKSYRKF